MDTSSFFFIDRENTDHCRWLDFSSRLADLPPEAQQSIRDGQQAHLPALPMKVLKGDEPADYYSTSLVQLKIVSDRFIETLKNASVVLPAMTPVVIHDRDDRRILDTRSWWIHLAEGTAPVDRSRGVYKQEQGSYEADAVGLFFDANSWNRHDIFLYGGTAIIGVTAGIAKMIARSRLANVKVEPVAEYGRTTRDAILRVRRYRTERGSGLCDE